MKSSLEKVFGWRVARPSICTVPVPVIQDLCIFLLSASSCDTFGRSTHKPDMLLSLLVALSVAGNAFAYPSEELFRRQATANDLDGPCKDVTLVFARASTEKGNMVCNFYPLPFEMSADSKFRVDQWAQRYAKD
jgi:hypothetical protein